MSERDAFGHGRNEDTLAGMGWREPTFTATIEGAAATPGPLCRRSRSCRRPRPPGRARSRRLVGSPTGGPRGRGRGRRGPRVMSRVLFLGIVAASVLFALRSGTGVIGDLEDAVRGRSRRGHADRARRAARCSGRPPSRPR